MKSFTNASAITLALPDLKILETERLVLRRFAIEDAAFILQLVNEPSWLRFIGDKGVKDIEGARGYIQNGPVTMYQRVGFGLYLVELKDRGVPIGMCGLIKRDTLVDVDIGFAFLPGYWGKGYALESAAAVMEYGRREFGLTRIVAITSPDNDSSIRLLEKIGMKFEAMVDLTGTGSKTKLFGCDFPVTG